LPSLSSALAYPKEANEFDSRQSTPRPLDRRYIIPLPAPPSTPPPLLCSALPWLPGGSSDSGEDEACRRCGLGGAARGQRDLPRGAFDWGWSGGEGCRRRSSRRRRVGRRSGLSPAAAGLDEGGRAGPAP